MPFTISHAAAVLPFARPLARWRLLSAAVIGSMAPDFGWFSPWRPQRFETHSLDALVTFCLPVGLAAYWLFQELIRTPILELLPPGAYARWRSARAPAEIGSVRQWLLAAGGILAGALTHLVWDGFTHEGGRGLRLLPALEEPAVEINGHHIGGSHLLQGANSIIGLIIVFAVLAYSLRPGRPEDAALARRLAAGERRLWIAAYLLAAVAFSALFFVFRHGSPAPIIVTGGIPLNTAAIAILRGLAAAVVSVSAVLAARLRPQAGGSRTA
jgi:hypothetical protein